MEVLVAMPRVIIEADFVKRMDVKAVLKLFETKKVMRYCEIRKGLGFQKKTRKSYEVLPIEHEVELVRILKRLANFGLLVKSKVKRNSYYRLNQEKFQEISFAAKKFPKSKKDEKEIEKELLEVREQNLVLILENTKLKERLAEYEGPWAMTPD